MIKSNGNKLKIFILSDDVRLFSGVGIMTDLISRAFVKEGWDVVHVAGSVRPTEQPLIDDIGRKILPCDGYGNLQIIRDLIKQEKPDLMWIMTDPRYFVWLWSFEDEIRTKIPIIYYHVWDAPPTPKYNFSYFNSCDSILCISKLSYNIVKQCKEETKGTFNNTYCPHGVPTEVFKPLGWSDLFEDLQKKMEWEKKGKKPEDKPPDISLEEFKGKLTQAVRQWNKDPEKIKFIVFWTNKNMRRKNAPTLMEAFHKFAKDKDDVMLLLHTEVVTDHGTDLSVVRDTLFKDVPIVLFPEKIPTEELVRFYNIADCVINIASAEGFGLSNLEAMACGIPTISIKTGGLQDQFYCNDDVDKPCGIQIDPASQILVGSPPTPYLYDDYINVDGVTDALEEMYNQKMKSINGEENEYKQWGKNGRENAVNNFNEEKMCQQHIYEVKRLLKEWSPRKKYVCEEV